MSLPRNSVEVTQTVTLTDTEDGESIVITREIEGESEVTYNVYNSGALVLVLSRTEFASWVEAINEAFL